MTEEQSGFMSPAIITASGPDDMTGHTPCCKVVIPFNFDSYLSRSCPECGVGYYATPTRMLGIPMIAWLPNGETNWGTR